MHKFQTIPPFVQPPPNVHPPPPEESQNTFRGFGKIFQAGPKLLPPKLVKNSILGTFYGKNLSTMQETLGSKRQIENFIFWVGGGAPGCPQSASFFSRPLFNDHPSPLEGRHCWPLNIGGGYVPCDGAMMGNATLNKINQMLIKCA